jgi:outer membrane immunogenic protein
MLRMKGIIITGLMALSSSVWSAGFYVGAGMGPDTARFDQDAVVIHNPSLNITDKQQHSGTGYFASVFAGYGRYFSGFNYDRKNLYLATELNVNASSLQFHSSNTDHFHKSFSSTQFKMDHSFGVSLLPGFLLTDTTLFYGRLGYSLGNFKIFTTDVSLSDTNKNLSGFRYGLGLEQSLTPRVAMRLEYSHIEYQGTSTYTKDPLSTVVKNTQYSPTTNQFEFGVIYRF